MLNKSIIRKTGQLWKIVVFFVGTIVSWVGLIAAIAFLDSNEEAFTLVIVFLMLGLCSMLFALIAVRCPVCNYHWVWVATSKINKSEWPTWLLRLEECPRCGCCNEVRAT